MLMSFWTLDTQSEESSKDKLDISEKNDGDEKDEDIP